MIDKVNKNKASKMELAYTETLLNNLNDRVKHLSSLMSTLANSMLPVKNAIGEYDASTRKKIIV